MKIRELMEGQSYFTLHFDKTVNADVKKQMDMFVHFWSETHNKAKVPDISYV